MRADAIDSCIDISSCLLLSSMVSNVALSGAAVALYFLWWLVRDYFVCSPLDNIPGPPSGSVWSGTYIPALLACTQCDVDMSQGVSCRWSTTMLGTTFNILPILTVRSRASMASSGYVYNRKRVVVLV